MKKLSLVFISLIFILNVASASTSSSDPKTFVSELVNDAIGKLSDKNLSKEEKSQFIEIIAVENENDEPCTITLNNNSVWTRENC